MWRLTQIRGGELGGDTLPWTCQLVAALKEGETLVLDLVPLEPRPGVTGDAAMAPITIRVRHDLCTSIVAGWAADADVVELTIGRTDGSNWLCLSSERHHLVLELPDETS